MPAVNCKYHPSTPARWYCDHCHISFCPGCVTVSESDTVPECPVCKRGLQSLGSENLVTPFWSRLREFFVFPAYPGPLLLILVLSAIATLIGYVPAATSVKLNIVIWKIELFYILLFPFVVVFLNYAYNVLLDTSHGHLKPIAINTDLLFGNSGVVFKLLLLMLFIELFKAAALNLFHKPGYQVAILLSAMALPAVIMVLAMENKFFHAINPAIVFSVVGRIGASYMILFAFFFLLDNAQFFLSEFLLKYIDESVSIGVYVFVAMYFYLIKFNMMGYVLYQHHGQLGLNVEVEMHEQEAGEKFNTVDVSPEMRAIEILIHEGQTEQALSQLKQYVKKHPSDTDARGRILKLCRLTGDTALHAEQARSYMSYLIDENKLGQAAMVYQGCYEYDKTLKPTKAAERLEMARYYKAKSKYKLATAVLNDLHRDFPTFDGIPQAYFIVAQILCEQFNEDDRAVKILEFVIKNYPAHPLKQELEEYLKIVKGLSEN